MLVVQKDYKVNKLHAFTILTSQIMDYQVHVTGKAIKLLFAVTVTNNQKGCNDVRINMRLNLQNIDIMGQG